MFTIQYTVDMGSIHVKQIAGVANQRLSDDERECFADAFHEALILQDKQLQSV